MQSWNVISGTLYCVNKVVLSFRYVLDISSGVGSNPNLCRSASLLHSRSLDVHPRIYQYHALGKSLGPHA